MNTVVIIPARYQSTRLPGKPLQDIAGKPMVVRVCESVSSGAFDQIFVACDDQRIADAVTQAGYKAVMTSPDHVSGTDRLQEAAEKLGLNAQDIVINVQGDEPLMPVRNLVQVANLLADCPSASVATLCVKERGLTQFQDANVVKVVSDFNHKALYFSRSPIPLNRDNPSEANVSFNRHVGLYAYRKAALDAFVTWSEGRLESLEKLEQLRFLENGHTISIAQAVDAIPPGVDTPKDLETVRALFQERI